MIYDIISVLFTAWSNPGAEKKILCKIYCVFRNIILYLNRGCDILTAVKKVSDQISARPKYFK